MLICCKCIWAPALASSLEKIFDCPGPVCSVFISFTSTGLVLNCHCPKAHEIEMNCCFLHSLTVKYLGSLSPIILIFVFESPNERERERERERELSLLSSWVRSPLLIQTEEGEGLWRDRLVKWCYSFWLDSWQYGASSSDKRASWTCQLYLSYVGVMTTKGWHFRRQKSS